MKFYSRSHHGFTLVEIMMVCTIIGLAAAMVIPACIQVKVHRLKAAAKEGKILTQEERTYIRVHEPKDDKTTRLAEREDQLTAEIEVLKQYLATFELTSGQNMDHPEIAVQSTGVYFLVPVDISFDRTSIDGKGYYMVPATVVKQFQLK